LEQISDWLTKILVGIGLAEIGSFGRVADYFQEGSGLSQPVVRILILNFSVLGFFGGYLLTRLFLAKAFYAAERATQEFAVKLEKVEELVLSLPTQVEKTVQGRTQAVQRLVTSQIEKELKTGDLVGDERKRKSEDLVFSYLYESPPRGFEKAIDATDAYVSEKENPRSALIWAYRAFAFGQKYKFDHAQGATDQLGLSRRKVLEAVQQAIDLEPAMRDLIRMTWDPHSPGKWSEDDDLEVFHDDPDFRKLLSSVAPRAN